MEYKNIQGVFLLVSWVRGIGWHLEYCFCWWDVDSGYISNTITGRTWKRTLLWSGQSFHLRLRFTLKILMYWEKRENKWTEFLSVGTRLNYKNPLNHSRSGDCFPNSLLSSGRHDQRFSINLLIANTRNIPFSAFLRSNIFSRNIKSIGRMITYIKFHICSARYDSRMIHPTISIAKTYFIMVIIVIYISKLYIWICIRNSLHFYSASF